MNSTGKKLIFTAEEVGLYKHLADYVGFLAFYPFFSILAYGLESLVLLFASEIFLSLIFGLLSFTVFRFSGIKKWGRMSILSVLFALSSLLVLLPYIFVFIFYLDPLFSLFGKLVGFISVGLMSHSLARNFGLEPRLDKFGGLIVLGSLILVIRDLLFILIGLIIVSLGLGGVSNELRKVYYRAKVSLELSQRRNKKV